MKDALAIILISIALIGVDILFTAGIVWIICWACTELGYTLVFSWPLAIAIWAFGRIIHSFFSWLSN